MQTQARAYRIIAIRYRTLAIRYRTLGIRMPSVRYNTAYA
jgi:hypothetical protein